MSEIAANGPINYNVLYCVYDDVRACLEWYSATLTIGVFYRVSKLTVQVFSCRKHGEFKAVRGMITIVD